MGKAEGGMSDWRQDLKEIPDYDQIPCSILRKANEKITGEG